MATPAEVFPRPAELLQRHEPRIWLAHCHIAEHHEGGMLPSITVEP